MNARLPLQALLTQTERERDDAQQAHARATDACRAAEAQAQQLLVYRRDYEHRWQAQFAREGRMELVHCYQGFMQRLTHAVATQAQVAEAAARQVERAVIALRDQELRCASVRKLLDRRLRDEDVAEERREQRGTDELAARTVRTTAPGGLGFGRGRSL